MRAHKPRGYILLLFLMLIGGLSLWIASAANARLSRLRATRAAAVDAQLEALARGGLELGLISAPLTQIERQEGDVHLIVIALDGGARYRACARRIGATGAKYAGSANGESFAERGNAAQRGDARACLDARATRGQLHAIQRVQP